jgi:hypothetical protein
MKPSFFSLFKRGKYYRVRSFSENGHQQGEETQNERKEVERFAVAAVAFCLKHDKDFLRHFWQNVCQQHGDPSLDKDALIEIEENSWSDLTIINGNCVAVVEFKAGAPLENKQNPNHIEFLSEKGYGWMLRQKNAKKNIRYTILGHSEHLIPDKGIRKRGIFCGQRSWDVLSSGYQPGKMLGDLFDSLANLHVKEFQLMKTKQIQVKRRINAEGAKAMGLIEEVKSIFKFTGSVDSGELPDEKTWWLGSNVEKSRLKQRTS